MILRFKPSSKDKHFYQTQVYEKKNLHHVAAYFVRFSRSQRMGFHYLSGIGLLRHSSLVVSRCTDVVSVQDVRYFKLHKLLSAVYDLFKYMEIVTREATRPQDIIKIYGNAKGRIAIFIGRVTYKFFGIQVTNKKCLQRFQKLLENHLPMLVLKLIQMERSLGELLTVFLDVKYRLPTGVSLVAALEKGGVERFDKDIRAIIWCTKNRLCNWNIPGCDQWLRGLSTLKSEFH